MRLTTIEFTGYRRLEDTACNVEGRTTAFIGPNESGKSSVLQGLEWLSNGSGPLPDNQGSRRNPPAEEDTVVRARFKIDQDEVDAIAAMGLETDVPLNRESLTEFRFLRRANGEEASGISSPIVRKRAPFVLARDGAKSLLPSVVGVREDVEDGLADAFEATLRQAESYCDPDDADWPDERLDNLRSSSAALGRIADRLADADGFPASIVAEIRDEAARLDAAVAAGELEDPDVVVRRFLLRRRPQFILFSDSDRSISARYNLSDEGLREAPPSPLANLLEVAGTDVNLLWAAMERGGTPLRTLEKKLNQQLNIRLTPMWSQSNLAVTLALDESGRMEVSIDEIDSAEELVTSLDERSDGFRTFLGLVCFLVAQEFEVPPILMIDEAERNLHYDAQADLVRVLTRGLSVAKVIYTTHSPGCLPLDIGTGIRVVSRHESEPISVLENDFWTKSEPNFSRLLFAMGAEASAFSAFRHAVLAEGVSEMLLLPTLMRNATDQAELDFQIAPGLSNFSVPRDLGKVAIMTVYLSDGDEAGDIRNAAISAAGVPESHVLQLPTGQAIEDLVDRATYLNHVDEWLEESFGVRLDRSALATDETIAHAVDLQLRDNPSVGKDASHKIIAFRLSLLGEDLKLAPGAKTTLKKLRKDIEAAFELPAYDFLSPDSAS